MGKDRVKQRINRTQNIRRRALPDRKQIIADKRAWSSILLHVGLICLTAVSVVAVAVIFRISFGITRKHPNSPSTDEVKEKAFDNSASVLYSKNDADTNPPSYVTDAGDFKSTIHNTLKPVSLHYNGRKIRFEEIKHENSKSSVRVYIADNFLSHSECDGLTAAHLSHVRETSKKSPIVCFAGVQTMNNYFKDIDLKYVGSASDFTSGTSCVNDSFSRSVSKRLHFSRSTAFYRGDSKFSELFEQQVEQATGLAKTHGGKFQITSYDINVGYRTHTDCTEDGDIRDRFATVLVYLQDVKEGGETKFPLLGISVKPVKGRLLVWNNMRPDGTCDPTSIHNAAKVINGRKFIIQRWYYYKNFPPLGKAHPEPALPERQQFQPRISCDQYDQGSCRWYDEWGYDHLVDYKLKQHTLI